MNEKTQMGICMPENIFSFYTLSDISIFENYCTYFANPYLLNAGNVNKHGCFLFG